MTNVLDKGFVELLRSGAYVNLNDIARPFGNRVDNWKRLQSTQELFLSFDSDPSYNGAPAVVSKEGRKGGSFAHPDIAIQFAQWCDPGFALWVSRQIRHLMIFGEVNLHHTEWTPQQRLQGLLYNREDINDLYSR